jgi:hypothetical protein
MIASNSLVDVYENVGTWRTFGKCDHPSFDVVCWNGHGKEVFKHFE